MAGVRLMGGSDLLKCSFCGKKPAPGGEADRRPRGLRLPECIDLCNEIVEEELAESSDLGLGTLPKPREINDS